MKKFLAGLLLAALVFGATSVSWGKGRGRESVTWEGVTWESADGSGVTWE